MYIDIKYLNLISSQLPLFKKKNDYTWNFRCPYCGDSQKSRTKARGYVFRKKNDLFYKCHNCGVGATLGNLIKHVDSKTYKDYIFERYRSGVKTNNPEPEFKFDVPKFPKKDILKGLRSISDLGVAHPARTIVSDRQIPKDRLSDLYLCESFFKFTNTLVKNKFPSVVGDHPRLIIPFRDEKGEVFAYQGRAFGVETPKYITIKLDDGDKVFGLDRLKKDETVYVVEGPIDSMFLDNAVATADADLTKADYQDSVLVFDNEPRNKEICRRIEKAIDAGRRVCLWPESNPFKDINDMILGGYTKEKIITQINQNTYQSMEAKLRFTKWRKINAY